MTSSPSPASMRRLGLESREVEIAPFLRDLAAAEPEQRTEVGELCAGSIDVDPDLLAQAVRNLLSNARPGN